jgi:hypothetical protein
MISLYRGNPLTFNTKALLSNVLTMACSPMVCRTISCRIRTFLGGFKILGPDPVPDLDPIPDLDPVPNMDPVPDPDPRLQNLSYYQQI